MGPLGTAALTFFAVWIFSGMFPGSVAGNPDSTGIIFWIRLLVAGGLAYVVYTNQAKKKRLRRKRTQQTIQKQNRQTKARSRLL